MTMTAFRALATGLILLATSAAAAPPEAVRVTIARDDWGIAHVHGKSDADTVFGAIYAQAEDDFPRIEANYLTALGRTAEAEGESAIWADLRQRLYIDPVALKADYRASPAWLRGLMDAWASGLNFYLATHPDVHPKVLTHFEPWMALSFTEGSIGGDIERADLEELAKFYGGAAPKVAPKLSADQAAIRDAEPRGSNGIAIAAKATRDGHALLLINPHTSFFFRSELEMTSDAGLHAYGASTWGQFFIYQGFNDHLGWMHTSSGVDAVDEFAETMVESRSGAVYEFGSERRAMVMTDVTLRYRAPDGGPASRTFHTWRSQHGPIVRAEGGQWIALALMNRPIPALEQSWLRTRATSFADYVKIAGLKANSSNDTILAGADGGIAYLHPQFVPKRDDRFDYRAPVDGSDPATAWAGLHDLADLPAVRNPAGGWLYNSNDAPWRAAGADSPKAAAFPKYMDQAGANPRGDHATALLTGVHDLTPAGLMKLAYDPAQPAFDRMLPPLFAAFDALPPGDRQRIRLEKPVAELRAWDRRASAESTRTTLAVFWGEALWHVAEAPAKAVRATPWDWIADHATPVQRLDALDTALARLQRDWGTTTVAWGEVNRFQRVVGFDIPVPGTGADIVQPFSDAKPSSPIPFTSARWGSLASFGSHAYPGTKRWYGTSGNSFVAVVEFGPKVKAWAVTAGGESGHPASPHFVDEVGRYASGDLRPVYFYPADLTGHVERTYQPGE